MRKNSSKWIGLAVMTLFFLPEIVLAAGGGPVAPLVIVADTRKLTGIMAWWANLYNESHLYFTMLTVALIPTIGVCFGVIADIVMSHVGIDLTSKGVGGH